MARSIAAWTPAELAPEGKVVPFVSIERLDDGRVAVTVRDAEGACVTAKVPADPWFVMARRIFQARSSVLGR